MFELLIDGVKLVVKVNYYGDLSVDVVVSGLALSGFDVAVEGLARDIVNVMIGVKFVIDFVGIMVDLVLVGGDIVVSVCYVFDDNIAFGVKATVSFSSGGLVDWTFVV